MCSLLRRTVPLTRFARQIADRHLVQRSILLTTSCQRLPHIDRIQLSGTLVSSRGHVVPLSSSTAGILRNFSTAAPDDKQQQQEPQKLTITAKFKQMFKSYWYVLVPVHLLTSACWLGSFYFIAKSGVDVVALMKSIGLSDRFIDPLKNSSMGYLALAYGLYKIATPVRFTVTIGGTTIAIKYLQEWGYIKPIPSKEKLKEMYQEKKEDIQEKYQETRQELRQRKYQLKERKDNVISDIAKYKQEIEEIKKGELKTK